MFPARFLFNITISLCLATNSSCTTEAQAPKSAIQNGDIIFHTSQSEQSKAIQICTESTYSHCGIIYIENGKTYVLEAVQPVKKTPFEQFVQRGEKGEYVVKRLRNAEEILNETTLKSMKAVGEKMLGKSYDSQFNWSDEKIYCSELVWKIYERATGIQLGELKKLKDYNFDDTRVQQVVKAKYNGNIPWEETMI
ncbi:MAG: YiiX family permuted papain-like enzyme, partial [Flavobacteriales bacterium]